MVAFTFERVIVVCYPLKRFHVCTNRRAKLIISVLAVAVAIVQILSLFTTGVTVEMVPLRSNITSDDENNSTTTKTDDNDENDQNNNYNQVMRILSLLETVVTLVIPPILIVIMNGFIIHGLFQFKRTFRQPAAAPTSPPAAHLIVSADTDNIIIIETKFQVLYIL